MVQQGRSVGRRGPRVGAPRGVSERRQLYAMEMQGYVQRIPGDWYVPMAV